MKPRNLKHHVSWENAWEEMRRERMKKPKVTYDDEFFKKSAKDFSVRIKLNDYEFGRKSTEILAEVIDDDFGHWINSATNKPTKGEQHVPAHTVPD